MTKNTICRCLLAGLALIIHSATALATGSLPLPFTNWKLATISGAVADTVPPAKSQQENKNNSQAKTDEIIKEVPKARKQEKPLAVITPAIKPVLIKPKIIVKPIIKVH